MTSRTVDKCLDEISRLVARNVGTQAHLYAAETLLAESRKLLMNMIAETTAQGLYRDELCHRLHAFLAEDFRPHHSPGDVA